MRPVFVSGFEGSKSERLEQARRQNRFNAANDRFAKDAKLKNTKKKNKKNKTTPTPTVTCKDKTKKGTPCKNGPQQGHVYCGPHLEKRIREGYEG